MEASDRRARLVPLPLPAETLWRAPLLADVRVRVTGKSAAPLWVRQNRLAGFFPQGGGEERRAAVRVRASVPMSSHAAQRGSKVDIKGKWSVKESKVMPIASVPIPKSVGATKDAVPPQLNVEPKAHAPKRVVSRKHQEYEKVAKALFCQLFYLQDKTDRRTDA